MATDKTSEDLLREIQDLRARLAEAEGSLLALRPGQADAQSLPGLPEDQASLLRESEERYRTLVENIDLGITVMDANYRIVMTNAAQSKILQKPLSELMGQKCFRVFEHRDAVCSHCPGAKAMTTGQREVLELTSTHPDGSQFDIRIQAFPYRDANGQITGFIDVVEDITQRKQVEEALRQNEALYRSLFENMLNGFAYCKMLFHQNQPQNFIYLKVNHSFAALTGLQDVEGKKVSEVIPGIRESDPELFEIYAEWLLRVSPNGLRSMSRP